VPSIFALVIGRSVSRSPSIYPADPESTHFDPVRFPPLVESESKSAAEAVQPDGHLGPVVVESHRVFRPATQPQADEHIRTPDGGTPSPATPTGPPPLPPSPGEI
jgi:hypothetical protein